jgi:hypothetical protein
MLTKEETEKLLEETIQALKDLSPEAVHFKTVYEAQIYVLKKILD